VGATFQAEDGLILMNHQRCIGCRLCTTACPYAVRYFNWTDPEFPSPLDEAHNPDVPLRTKGVVEKCTFCVHRLGAAQAQAEEEGRELSDAEVVLLPACNQACPASARYFGDLEDPGSSVSRLARSQRAYVLFEELGTEPSVYYLTSE
jgi:molybdopterin-containing oxidoreductase family iron-sulfur binding subunit